MSALFSPYLAFGKLDENGFFEEDSYSMVSYAIGGYEIHHFGTNNQWQGVSLNQGLGSKIKLPILKCLLGNFLK